MARCPHIKGAPIYDRCYDKRIYRLYLCLAKHLVTELSIFWLDNGVVTSFLKWFGFGNGVVSGMLQLS